MRTFATVSLLITTVLLSTSGDTRRIVAQGAAQAAAQGQADDSRLSQAEALLREGKFGEAATHYEEILKGHPTFVEAYFALGVSYSQIGRPREAEESFRKYLSSQPSSADGHTALGLLLLQQNRYAEAKPVLEQALQLEPDLIEARKALGRVHFLNADFVAATRQLELVIHSEPNAEPEVYTMLATSRFNTKDKKQAIGISERALQIHPASEPLESLYVSLLLDCSASSECVAKLEQGFRQKPDSPAYLKGIAKLAMQRAPRSTQAEQILARVIQTLPHDAEARYLYGQWAYLSNKHQLCVDELSKALALPSIDGGTKVLTHALLGLAEEKLNNVKLAEAAFQKSLELNRKLASPNPTAAFQYAEFLAKHSRHAESQKVVDEILRWSPSFGLARFERAKFLAKQKLGEKAVEEAKVALENLAGNQDQLRAVHAFLAKTYFAIGRQKEAQLHQSWIEAHTRP